MCARNQDTSERGWIEFQCRALWHRVQKKGSNNRSVIIISKVSASERERVRRQRCGVAKKGMSKLGEMNVSHSQRIPFPSPSDYSIWFVRVCV